MTEYNVDTWYLVQESPDGGYLVSQRQTVWDDDIILASGSHEAMRAAFRLVVDGERRLLSATANDNAYIDPKKHLDFVLDALVKQTDADERIAELEVALAGALRAFDAVCSSLEYERRSVDVLIQWREYGRERALKSNQRA